MQGQVDLALRQERPVEEYRRVLALVQAKTRHLSQIVEALLFLARADAESQDPRLEPIELAGWLRDHLGPREDPGAGDVRLEPSEGRTHLGSGPRRRCSANCSTTCSTTPASTASRGRRSSSAPSKSASGAKLSVEDRGIGIDGRDIPHLADPFYRTAEARGRDAKGLGLGLSVAARIAETFGGRLEVESRPGVGSTFVVVLPVAGSILCSPTTSVEADAALRGS